VRIRATYNAVTYDLFGGFIERWPPTWPGGLLSETTIQCVDGFKILAQARSNYTWGVEDSHWRIIGVLAAAGWPATDEIVFTSLDVRAGKSTIPAVNLANTPPLSHILDVALAEDGQFFMNGQGYAVFQGRHQRIGYSRSTTVQQTYGDELNTTTGWVLGNATNSVIGVTTIPRSAAWVSGTASELPFINVQPSYDDQFIVNAAAFIRPSGVEQTASDATSQARYSVRSQVQTLQLTTDTAVLDRATWAVAKGKEPDIRFISLTLSGHHRDTLWPAILSAEISDRIAVIIRPPSSYAIRRECYIEAIEHRNITMETWATIYSLSPAPLPGSDLTGFWIIEDTTFGVLESTTRLVY